MADEFTIGLNAVGRFPEVGNKIQDINFFHGLSFSFGLNGRILWGFHNLLSIFISYTSAQIDRLVNIF
jgi:hypothetical protein